jgi:hypothetical protein
VGNVLHGLNTSTILLLLSDCCYEEQEYKRKKNKTKQDEKCRTRRTETSRVAKGMPRATDRSIPDMLVKCIFETEA